MQQHLMKFWMNSLSIILSWNLHPPVCFIPTCKMAERFNCGILKKQHPNFELCKAKDKIDCKTKSQEKNARVATEKLNKLYDPHNTAGIKKSLPLAKGLKIMLRQNLGVADGLLNGAMGGGSLKADP